MSGKLPHTSPLKDQPPSKRPNSSLGNPIQTRGATAAPVPAIRKLGTLILTPIAAFDGKRLPSNSEVLQRLFYVKDQDLTCNKSTRSLIDQIFPEIEALYAKVPCPMKRKDSCLTKIQNLYEKWRNMTKDVTKSSASTISSFQSELSKLCDLSAKDAIENISKDRQRDPKQQAEDVKFMLDQKTSRKSTLSPQIDQSFSERQQRIEKRKTRSFQSQTTSDSTSKTDSSED